MRRLRQLAFVVLLVASLYSVGSNAHPAVETPHATPPGADVTAVPDQGVVEAFTRKAQMEFSDYGEGRALVSDRILDGFQAAPSRLSVTDGSSISWGFKNQEANLQSVVIGDKSGQLKLVAAVDGVVRLARTSGAPIADLAQYEQAVERSGAKPSVMVFVNSEDELETYLPLLKRWLQANLMGFNADCERPALTSACELVEHIVLPTTVYIIAADGSLHRINVPAGQAAALPLRSFIQ